MVPAGFGSFSAIPGCLSRLCPVAGMRRAHRHVGQLWAYKDVIVSSMGGDAIVGEDALLLGNSLFDDTRLFTE